MDYSNPPVWLVTVERLVNNYLCSPMYGSFVRSLRLKGTERVLDFGSGSGAEARHLARVLARGGGRLTCVDISEAWLGAVRKELVRYPFVEFRLGDIFTAGVEDGAYDVIVVHWVLHDVDRQAREATVKALAGKLKPDGELVLREPVQAGHGIAPEEVRALMESAGLIEESFRLERAFFRNAYRALYKRKKSLEEQMEEYARGGS